MIPVLAVLVSSAIAFFTISPISPLGEEGSFLEGEKYCKSYIL